MFVGIALLAIAIFQLAIATMAWKQRLPGNRFIGLRVPEVRKSADIWNTAHRVAAPLWLLSGVAFGFAGLSAWNATGWGWALPVVLFIIALAAYGAGAAQGAHTAAAVDARRIQEEANGGPAAAVDLQALRRAAQQSEKPDNS
ncbi:SdpI family protein [Corynebacterium caspium]|uniref:SdpI family protein n=1 Tax=Corynebacterium caspium TaxID=234828 RepID=UPI000372A497|nr:SdpI family protein [Corynebacterium caspium]WKD60041.1 hypothetical protein CCASP_08345 [Corynebacterium caspium DSM 44850]